MKNSNLNVSFDSLITKATRGKNGEMYLTAIASDNFADTRDDAISENGLDIMKTMADDGVEILENHNSTFSLGKTTNGALIRADDESGLVEFMIEMTLDPSFPQSQQLFNAVEEGSDKYKMSVGLAIDRTDPESVLWRMSDDGGMIRVLNKFALDHIAVTRETSTSAINQRARFLTAIKKSLEVLPIPENIEKVLDKKSISSEIEDHNQVTPIKEEIMTTNTIADGTPSVTADQLTNSISFMGMIGKALVGMGLGSTDQADMAILKSVVEGEAEVKDESESAEVEVIKANDASEEEVITETADETVEKIVEKSEDKETSEEVVEEVVEKAETDKAVEEKSEEVATEDAKDDSNAEDKSDDWAEVDTELGIKSDESSDEEVAGRGTDAEALMAAFIDKLDGVANTLNQLDTVTKALSDRLDAFENLESEGGEDAAGTVHVVNKAQPKDIWKGILNLPALRSAHADS